MKRITTLKHNLMRAAMTLALIVTCATAWATDVQTYYIDENGTSHNVTATVLTGSETRLTGGWYVVKSNISYTNQIGYTSPLGTINIILADGAEMTVNVSNNQTSISLSSNFPLAIYGQSAGTGRLTVTSENNAIYAGGGLTINGGIVSATSTGDGYSAIYADDKAITINGGQVTATPGDNATGICTYGTITLGLNKSTDFITANGGYFGTVNIKSGQTLYDGATAYSGNNVSLPSGTVTLRPYSSDDFSVSGDEYTIHTAAGWGMFCDMLADNDKGIFTGKTVKLGASISVSRMAGSAYHDFTGIFNGQGNTLTFTYSATEAYAAPFRYVEGPSATVHAAIQNLNVNSTVTGTNCRHLSGLIGLSGSNVDVSNCNVEVHITSTKSSDNELYPSGLMSQCTGPVIISGCTVTGEIGTNAKYAAGFLGIVQGSATIATITNCVSSVTINSSTAGDGTHGGFVAVSYPGSTTIEGCLFNGKLLTVNTGETATGNCGGFVGWRTTGTVTISNSLYAPADLDDGETEVVTGTGDYPSATFVRNGSAGTNCYYTRALGTAQGKQRHSITAGSNVTINAIALTGNTTNYNVSGITAYSNGGLSLGSTLYYGNEDQVNLTLSNTPPTGYTFNGYAASNGGTITGTNNPYTLTMPDADVTISATMTPNTYTVQFNGNGNTGGSMSNQAFTYDVAQNLTTNAFTRTDYNFAGWNTQANGGGTSYTDGQSVSNLTATNNGTVTLYAQWTPAVESVTYLDADGVEQQCTNYTILTGTITNTGFAAGWYVAEDTVTFNNTININGDAHLILKDGAVVHVGTEGNPVGTYGIRAYGHSLSIYGQSTGADKGQLHVYSSQSGIYASNASVTINGGEVTTTGTNYGIYASSDGAVTINGGQVTATGTNSHGIYTSSNTSTVTISGGEVTANGNTYGINAKQGTVTISGGHLTATGGYGISAVNSGSVIISGGQVTTTGGYSGIQVNSSQVTISGGEVTAIGSSNYGIYATNSGQVTINDGQVTVTGTSGIYVQYGGASLTINGGEVTVTGTNSGIYAYNGTVNISGGEVTATGTVGFDVNGGTVTISGGQLTDITNGHGFYIDNNGSVTFGWTNPSDFILASNYGIVGSGSISIAEGKAFITDDGTTYQSGALTNEQLAAIAGKKLYPYIPGAVFYMDMDGDMKLCTQYTMLTGNETGTLPGGWYVVLDDISYNNGITFGFFAHLILADGKTMTANGEFSAVNAANLTIYGQRLGTGKLIATGNPDGEGDGITAGDVTINGGQVTASGSSSGIYAQSSVTINGGQVTATGQEDSGIWVEYGIITLGWNRATDFIYANSYDGYVCIKEGKTFIDDDGNIYESGTVSASAINGKTLYPYIEPSTVTQTIMLSEGWNWISTYIDLNEVNGIEMLEEALGDYGVTIQTYNESADYFGDGEWSGLEEYGWTNAEMIMIEVSEDCTIDLAGPTVDPSTVEIEIHSGWNWIGFPVATETAIGVAMAGFEAEEEDAIQSNVDGTSDYLDEWVGDVLTLVPGQGYMYYSNSTEPKTLVFSTTTKGKSVFSRKHKE